VAVIGAGCAGLLGIKCCLDEGLTPVCYERTDAIGGLWRYTEDVKDGQACVMKSTVINTSKEMTAFSDFPMPAEFPNFMHNKYVLRYFHMYCEKFDLMKHIHFNTEIVRISKHENFSETGQWNVKVRDRKSGKEISEIFDAVLVCTGHHAEKKVPKFEGQEEFQGKVIHSHDYKKPTGFEDKRAVVVGIGNSGVDVAVEISRHTDQTFLSTRRGAWVFNRVWDDGHPFDMVLTTRYNTLLWNFFPANFMNSLMEKKMQKFFKHENYDLRPKHRFNAQHPTINDDLPNRIAAGDVVVKPDIRYFTKTGIEFVDGTCEDNIDIVVLATGYIFGFPFIDKEVIDVKDNKADLFKYCFPVNLEKPTLAVIGYIQPIGSVIGVAELQCRWATRVFKGVQNLPSRADMIADVQSKRKALSERYVDSTRHTIQVDWIPFMDEIAEQIGAKPDLKQLLFSDPVLAFKCFFGPCTPYQYRLQGPGQWSGARNAIMTQWDRCIPVNKDGRPGPRAIEDNSVFGYAVAALFIGIILFIFFI